MNLNNPILIGLIIGITIYIFLYFLNTSDDKNQDNNKQNIIISIVIGTIICVVWYFMTIYIAHNDNKIIIKKQATLSGTQSMNNIKIPKHLPQIKL